MSKRETLRLSISVTLLTAVIAAVFWFSDASAAVAIWPDIFVSSVVLVALLLLGSVILASLRLKLVAADLGYPLTFRDAAVALSVGQLAGIAFSQFGGQLIGQSAVLSRRGIPPAATVISGYERVAALGVSLMLAGSGALYLFGTLSINLETGGVSLIKLALGLATVITAGALFAWGPAVVNLARKLTPTQLVKLFRSFFISLVIQGTMLAAYVALENVLAPHIGLASLTAASCIVMLAASLPISFGGWGLRELSAVVALQAIGLSSASALVVALVIGFMSLAVVAGLAAFIMVGWRPKALPEPAIAGRPAMPNYTSALDWVLPLMAASAMFFQIHIPTGAGKISINLADPVVILGASLLVLHHVGKGWPVWRIPHVGAWVMAASAVILLSMLHGWASFGWTDWAFVNRGLGWLVLLCYGATGALIVRRAQHRGLEFLLKTLATSGSAIALIDIGVRAAARLGVELAGGLVEPRISGLSQNANAFAFVLVLVLCAAIMLRERSGIRVGLVAVALTGIWFTGSRAGFLTVPVVLGSAWLLGVALRPLVIAVLAAAATIFLLSDGFDMRTEPDFSTAQHLLTIHEGLMMFMAHPIFGAGLGAYMEGQLRSTGAPLIIHSTLVWLLAETGIVGTAVFLGAAWHLFSDALKRRGDPVAFLLLLMLGTLAMMSLAHEMLYQRGFWLLLGAVLAMPAAVTEKTEKFPPPRVRSRARSIVPA